MTAQAPDRRPTGDSLAGGNLAETSADAPALRLTTTGAKTGRAHTISLPYGKDGSRFVIIAGEQGSRRDPDWYHDLLANPNVTVELDDETFRAVAHVAQGAERQRLFDQIAARHAHLVELQGRLTGEIPIVVLERVLDRETDYNAFNRDLIAEFRANGGKVGGMFEGLDLLLLTTIGAKSGQPRTAPLLYNRDGDRLVVIASKGGAPTHPDWYRNLLANPDVMVELGSERFPARATVAEGAERQRLFEMLLTRVPMLAGTQASTARQLPLVVLERTA